MLTSPLPGATNGGMVAKADRQSHLMIRIVRGETGENKNFTDFSSKAGKIGIIFSAELLGLSGQ
ncbi:MAG TPA: hypothetical protein PLU49_06540 [Saprospiraceae bacterium]|nr:hypothetical protein [Saprospiraceae bacterium]